MATPRTTPSTKAPTQRASSRAKAEGAAAGERTSSSRAPTTSAPRSSATLPASTDALATYRKLRDFGRTPEPSGGLTAPQPARAAQAGGVFVIQKHWATRLHYDFRLELDGVMKSWAVPKGPSLDPRDKRMAAPTEDHPIEYNSFDGVIPAGQYGSGRVVIWDNGTWTPVGNPHEGLAKGDLKFELHGRKLRGRFVLVRIKKSEQERKPAWLLIKEKDEHVRSSADYDITEARPEAVPAFALPPPPPATSPAGANAARPKRALPDAIEPQLATLVRDVPIDATRRLWEIKLDGYRLLARIDAKGKARLHTRNGLDWSGKFAALVRTIEALGVRSTWLDGELVALDAQGLPSFDALQAAIATRDTEALIYFVFDLPFVDGEDWRDAPLVARRARLEQVVADPGDNIRLSQSFDVPPAQLVAASKAAGLEGLIGKRVDAPYRSGRSDLWVKLKNGQRQEFVIAGYTRGEGAREGTLGALVLAAHDEHGVLRHAGNVGSGFDGASLELLKARLEPLRTKVATLDAKHPDLKHVRWVRPELVAQVRFSGITRDGHVRHAVFLGLREDKAAADVREDELVMAGVDDAGADAEAPVVASRRTDGGSAAKASSGSRASRTASPGASLGISISHPERVVDASTGLTKLDVARYYERVAPLMLEHLAGRPVSLLRAPDGLAGQTFFQKHLDRMTIAGVAALDPAIDTDHEPLIEIRDRQGLMGLVQMNVLEVHVWNATTAAIEQPDGFVLDLDPGDGVPWPHVQEAALLVRTLLQEVGLEALLKTSGGKGLHVIVPIVPDLDWTTVKTFSQAVAQHVAKVIPQRFTATSGARNRVGKIFIDYLRNTRGATTVCAWSTRARPGLGVSVPIGWDELARVSGGAHWHVRNIDERLRLGNGPWQARAKLARPLAAAIERLADGT